jgi:8-amino-7-oxononanoate synthase
LNRPGGLAGQRVQAAIQAWVRLDGRWVVNFCSANFLGYNCTGQAESRLPGCFSLGMPRGLAETPLSAQVEARLARLVGQEAALIFPSTTHAALDILPLLAGRRGTIFLDEQAYPISRQGAVVAQAQGARIFSFGHNDPGDLARKLEASWGFAGKGSGIRDFPRHLLKSQPGVGQGERVIVCDGVYPLGGELAPLRALEQLARLNQAVLYVDDAHGLGMLGRSPDATHPLGRGGGGSAQFADLPPGNLVVVGSLSKAFGVPLAFAAGPAEFIQMLRELAGSLVHSSPPALPVLAAARRVLRLHRRQGEARRRRLLANIRLFRRSLETMGLQPGGLALLPVQSLHYAAPEAAWQAARALRAAGFWALMQPGPVDNPAGGALRFVLSALHTPAQIRALAMEIRRIEWAHGKTTHPS